MSTASTAVPEYGQFLSPLQFLEEKHRICQSPTQVLDGYVKLVDVMGDEQSIANAARVTAQSEAKTPADDYGLIRYLMRHRHTTPLEMVELKFEVMVAMDTWRQWIRHRTANVNEYSTRYTEAIDACQTTAPTAWRVQATSNRQGSGGHLDPNWKLKDAGTVLLTETEQKHVAQALEHFPEITVGEFLTRREMQLHDGSRRVYEARLQFGIAKEQARKDLPLSTMTKAIWKCDMHNLLHFLGLRMDGHAQFEIRSYANAIGDIVARLYPVTWEAFRQYRLNALTLTELDIGVVKKLTETAMSAATDDTALDRKIGYGDLKHYLFPCAVDAFLLACPPQWHGARNRERDECLAKLQRLNLVT